MVPKHQMVYTKLSDGTAYNAKFTWTHKMEEEFKELTILFTKQIRLSIQSREGWASCFTRAWITADLGRTST